MMKCGGECGPCGLGGVPAGLLSRRLTGKPWNGGESPCWLGGVPVGSGGLPVGSPCCGEWCWSGGKPGGDSIPLTDDATKQTLYTGEFAEIGLTLCDRRLNAAIKSRTIINLYVDNTIANAKAESSETEAANWIVKIRK